MLSPCVLARAGVPVHQVVQAAGELVVTFPSAYHANLDTGVACLQRPRSILHCMRLCKWNVAILGGPGCAIYHTAEASRSRPTGFTCSEGVDFGPADWLRFLDASMSRHRRFRQPSAISHELLLLQVRRSSKHFAPAGTSVIAVLVPPCQMMLVGWHAPPSDACMTVKAC